MILNTERGDGVRRENPRWEYNRETSLYDRSDYRSKFYNGKWEKAWLKEVASYVVNNQISLYESMWLKYAEKHEHMPQRLFKFFPFNQNSLKCIETNSVFMNNPRNFNDPFDSVICASKNEFLKQCLVEHLTETGAINREILTTEEMDKLKYSRCEESEHYSVHSTFDSVVHHLCYDADKHEMRKGYDEIINLMIKAEAEYDSKLERLKESIVGITSFADINDFKLTSYMELWSHYAQNHEGFCVEYDLTQPIADANDNAMVIGGLLPCSYGSRQIVLSKQKIYKYIKDVPMTLYEKMEFEKSIMLSFLTKSSSWRYENEWRLILPLDICEIYENMIPFFPIKAIYTGCRMPKDNREFIYRLAQRKGVTVYDMSMNEYRFELEGDYLPVDIEQYFKNIDESRLNKLKMSRYVFFQENRYNES